MSILNLLSLASQLNSFINLRCWLIFSQAVRPTLLSTVEIPSPSPSRPVIKRGRIKTTDSPSPYEINPDVNSPLPTDSPYESNPDINIPLPTDSPSVLPSPDLSLPSPWTLDFWRDSLWQSIGVIASTLLAILAIVLTLKQFQKKAFSYEVVSKENIVKVADDSIGNDLQILYKGTSITMVRTVFQEKKSGC